MSLFLQLIALFIISAILAPIVLRGVTFCLQRF